MSSRRPTVSSSVSSASSRLPLARTRGLRAASALLSVIGAASMSGCPSSTSAPSPPGAASVGPEAAAVSCGDGRVRVDAGAVAGLQSDFCIDVYEAPGFDQPPAQLSIDEAAAWCAERGARLCSELEWETACRGPSRWRFPYGNSYSEGVCVTESQAPRAAGQRSACRSGFGPYDMSGNAAEWVRNGVLKGGDARSDGFAARCGARSSPAEPDAPTHHTARCCKDLAPMPEGPTRREQGDP